MQYIVKNMKPADSLPRVLANGTKTLSISFRKLKIIDSYSFLPMALDKFSKTFNLNELKKGFFPHKANKPEFFNYDGPYFDKEYYGSEFFSNEKKLEFDNWYSTVQNNHFNFKKEIEDYCWSDVQLLTEGCLAFRSIVINQTKTNEEGDQGVDPFQISITIASMCNYIFRRNLMEESSSYQKMVTI